MIDDRGRGIGDLGIGGKREEPGAIRICDRSPESIRQACRRRVDRIGKCDDVFPSVEARFETNPIIERSDEFEANSAAGDSAGVPGEILAVDIDSVIAKRLRVRSRGLFGHGSCVILSR